jgi:hypothetical protein
LSAREAATDDDPGTAADRRARAMKLTDEHQHIPIPVADGRTVEGIVHVRGVDLRVRGRGVVFERRTPVAAVVRTRDALRRLAIEERRGPPWTLAVAAPLVSLIIRTLATSKKEARK